MSICKVSGCRFKHSHTTKSHKCGTCGKYGHGQVECSSNYLKNQLKVHYSDTLDESRWCTFKNCKYHKTHSNSAHNCINCGERGHCVDSCPKKKHKVKCPICNKVNIFQGESKLYGLSEKCKICLCEEINVILPECKHACICTTCMLKLDTYVNDDYSNLDELIIIQNDLPPNIIQIAKDKFKLIDGKIYTSAYGGMGCIYYLRRDSKHSQLQGFFLHSDMQGQYGSGPKYDHSPYVELFTEGYTCIY